MADILAFAVRPLPEDATPLIRLLQACIDIATAAGRPLSLRLLADIMLSAPRNRQQFVDDAWAEGSICSRCIVEAEARLDAGQISEDSFNRVLSFWSTVYEAFDTMTLRVADRMFVLLSTATGPFPGQRQ